MESVKLLSAYMSGLHYNSWNPAKKQIESSKEKRFHHPVLRRAAVQTASVQQPKDKNLGGKVSHPRKEGPKTRWLEPSGEETSLKIAGRGICKNGVVSVPLLPTKGKGWAWGGSSQRAETLVLDWGMQQNHYIFMRQSSGGGEKRIISYAADEIWMCTCC